MKWEDVYRLYIDRGLYVPLRDHLIMKGPDGILIETSFDFSDYEGDWKTVIEIVHRNLPSHVIGNADEYKPGRLI